jgi:hypothetical protein
VFNRFSPPPPPQLKTRSRRRTAHSLDFVSLWWNRIQPFMSLHYSFVCASVHNSITSRTVFVLVPFLITKTHAAICCLWILCYTFISCLQMWRRFTLPKLKFWIAHSLALRSFVSVRILSCLKHSGKNIYHLPWLYETLHSEYTVISFIGSSQLTAINYLNNLNRFDFIICSLWGRNWTFKKYI